MAVEFRNALAGAVERPLPATLLFSYPALDDIAEHLARDIFGWAAAPTAASRVQSGDLLLGAIEELSEEDVERLFAVGSVEADRRRGVMNDFLARIEKLSPKRLALLAYELQARLDRGDMDRNDPVYIIGMGCRFPGARNPDAFWRLPNEGRDAVSEVPPTAGTSMRCTIRIRTPRAAWQRAGRVPGSRRSVRRPVLRHRRPRGGEHGPAATVVAGSCVGSAGTRWPVATRPRRSATAFLLGCPRSNT